jgi:hypothetical protein
VTGPNFRRDLAPFPAALKQRLDYTESPPCVGHVEPDDICHATQVMHFTTATENQARSWFWFEATASGPGG